MKTNEKDRKEIARIEDAISSSINDTHRQYKEQVWHRGYLNWRNILENKVPGRSNLFIPQTFQTVETMIAKALGALFNHESIFTFDADKSHDANDVRNADILAKYCSYQLSTIPGFYRKWNNFLRKLFIYGTAVYKCYWDYRWIPDPRNSRERIVLYDNFNFKEVNLRNFHVDPKAKFIEEAKFVVERSVMEIDEFKALIKEKEFRGLSEKEAEEMSSNYTDANLVTENVHFEQDDYLSLTYDKERRFIEILEYWNVSEDIYGVCAGRKVMVRPFGSNPFKHKRYPYIVGIDTPDPEHFWGLSTCETMQDLQAEINAIRNNRMDKFNFLMNPMYKAKFGSVFNRKDLIPRQGGIVQVRNMDDLQRLDLGDVRASDYNEEQVVKGDIQAVSSISDYSLGQGSQGLNDTATGVSIIDANANSRIVSKLELIEEEVLIPMGDMFLELFKQFGDDTRVALVAGEPVTISKDMIGKHYRIKTKGATQLINQQTRQQQMMQMAQLMINNPYINIREFMKLFIETFGFSATRLLQDIQPQTQGIAPQNAQAPGTANPNQTLNEQGQKQPYNYVEGKPV